MSLDIQEILSLLRRLEWLPMGVSFADDPMDREWQCPICRQAQPIEDDDDDQRPWMGHARKCQLFHQINVLMAMVEPAKRGCTAADEDEADA